MSDQIWLTLSGGVSVGIDRAEALALDRKGFARLYRDHVVGAPKKVANAWAEKQVAERAAHYKEAADACL